MFQSVPYRVNENTDLYVDGGLLCNYPIHAFDGTLCQLNCFVFLKRFCHPHQKTPTPCFHGLLIRWNRRARFDYFNEKVWSFKQNQGHRRDLKSGGAKLRCKKITTSKDHELPLTSNVKISTSWRCLRSKSHAIKMIVLGGRNVSVTKTKRRRGHAPRPLPFPSSEALK